MRGLAIMLVGTAVVGWLASLWLGGVGGAVVGILAFVGWALLNRHSGEDGLFRANLKSYFIARRSGHSVEEALKSMIEARYAMPRPDLPERAAIKRRLLESLAEDGDAPERVRVLSTVLMVWRHEHDAWSLEPQRGVELYSKVDQMYEDIARSYGFPVVEPTVDPANEKTSEGIVACPSCTRKNRVPAGKPRASAVCAMCHARLFQ